MTLPPSVETFLSGKRIAVAGASRSGTQPANAILRRLRDSGFDAIPINPKADQLEGATCYRDLAAVPGVVDGLMVVTHPAATTTGNSEQCQRPQRQYKRAMILLRWSARVGDRFPDGYLDLWTTALGRVLVLPFRGRLTTVSHIPDLGVWMAAMRS
jgi:acyl-CoA synthetase (NDP forming)